MYSGSCVGDARATVAVGATVGTLVGVELGAGVDVGSNVGVVVQAGTSKSTATAAKCLLVLQIPDAAILFVMLAERC